MRRGARWSTTCTSCPVSRAAASDVGSSKRRPTKRGRRYPGERVFLFVFDQNLAARRFYASIGGREVERGIVEPPGGGSQVHWRVAWDDAAHLLASVGRYADEKP